MKNWSPGVHSPDELLVDLAHARLGYLFGYDIPVRDGVFRYLAFRGTDLHERFENFFGNAVTPELGFQDNQQHGPLSPLGVGNADGRSLLYRSWVLIAFSRSSDDTHSPPVLMTSLSRSVICMYPSLSR